jgi:hypothetical protein
MKPSLTTETLLSVIKLTEPTNKGQLVKYFGCSYDMIEMHLTSLMYTKNKYNNSIYTRNNGTEIVSNNK